MKTSTMKRLAVLCLTIAACSDTTPTGTDQLNLDRPVDISFACYGGLRLTGGQQATVDQQIIVSAQPVAGCIKRSEPHDISTPTPTVPGQEPLTGSGGLPVPEAQWVGFILQSEPGTVAIANWNTKPSSEFSGGDVTVLDANPLTPGKNGISVGEDPVAISTDVIGCKEVIANAGSCDMSILDINSAMTAGTTAIVNRLDVTLPNGNKVRAKPFAMAMQPPGGTVGNTCGPTATGLAYVAYPSCHAVAAIDTATGIVQQAITFDAAGVPTLLTDANQLSCPDECAGAATTAGTRPVALALENDDRVGRQVLAIGADNSNVLTVAELDPTTSLPLSFSSRIALENTPNGDLGITSIAVSPQIGMGGAQGIINDDASVGGQMQFVYAVATDNTIRVADILASNKECDTQVDPRYLRNNKNVKQMSCLPVGDPTTPPRRAGARGPGISLIGDSIPTSVTITKVDPVMGDPRVAGYPTRLIGYFAFATAANGATYVINVDNDDFADYVDAQNVLGTQIPLDIAHQLRDSIPDRGLLAVEADPKDSSKTVPICDTLGPDPDSTNGNDGGARSTDVPAITLPTATLAAEKVGVLPKIRDVKCVGQDEMTGKPVAETEFAAPVSPVNIREQVFPDLRGLRGDETWTFTWEGSLSQDGPDTHIDGPAVRESEMMIDALGAHIVDQSKPFCDAGVEPHDIVQLRGCDPSLGDADCALGYTCFVHPQSKVAGIGACMLKDEADRLATACKPFLTSLRRYTVKKSTTGQLDLLPRKHVLRTSPVDGCTDDAQCQTLANYAARLDSSANPVDDKTPDDPHKYTCEIDPDRAPIAGTGKRCIETCATDADCDDGTVCDNGTCMESVVPPQACVNAGQRYELRAGEAFAVVGTRSGYLHPIIADANGNCVKDPNANPFLVGRFPLNPPACDPNADPLTDALPGGGFGPNPCLETIDQTELQTNYANLAGGTCTIGSPASTLVTRQADAVLFRNRGMRLDFIDPTYPGDQVCIGDRGANLGRIPVVTPGFQITFRQTAGFSPLLVQITPAFPVKIVTGPTESVWVLDEGDFLSTSIATPSTRGKVYRFEGAAITTVNLLE